MEHKKTQEELRLIAWYERYKQSGSKEDFDRTFMELCDFVQQRMRGKLASTHVHSAVRGVVTCQPRYFRADCLVTSRSGTENETMGEMKRAIAQEHQERRTTDRFASTLVIAFCDHRSRQTSA
jgi:hypothetical protein